MNINFHLTHSLCRFYFKTFIYRILFIFIDYLSVADKEICYNDLLLNKYVYIYLYLDGFQSFFSYKLEKENVFYIYCKSKSEQPYLFLYLPVISIFFYFAPFFIRNFPFMEKATNKYYVE